MGDEIILRLIDSGIALAILVWIVNMGQKQLERMYKDHYDMTNTLIIHLLKDNQRLGDTLISCVSVAARAGDK